MDMINITPSMLRGEVKIPPSKSMAYRTVIAAFLAKGHCSIGNIDMSEDVAAMLSCIETMGAKCRYNKKNKALDICSDKLKGTSKRISFDCGVCGGVIQLFIPIAMALGFKCEFKGMDRQTRKTIEPCMKMLEEKGISYTFENELLTTDGKLSGGVYVADGSIDNGFLTGLLFALSMLSEDSELLTEGKSVSKSNIDMTVAVMSDFGVKAENHGYDRIIIKGGQQYKSHDCIVESDFSRAAFFLVAGAIGCDVCCTGMNPESVQGDRAILDILARAGAKVKVSAKGKISASFTPNMHGIVVDASEILDIVPVIAVLLCFCRGESSIINAGSLRLRECDKIRAIASELRRLGADVTEGSDYLKIRGRQVLDGNVVSAWCDHHIAMALSVAACRTEGDVGITGARSVISKAYPEFFEEYAKLGGQLYDLR